MSSRLALAMSASALAVTLLGSTPLGHAIVSNVPRNSVGPLQLKRNAVGPQKVAPNAIRSSHVLNGSLLADDFKAGQIPAGPAGPVGPAGPAGPPGVSLKEIVQVDSASDSSSTKQVTATCPAGKQALGGGTRIISPTFGPVVSSSRPQSVDAWFGQTYEVVATNAAWSMSTFVICARVG